MNTPPNPTPRGKEYEKARQQFLRNLQPKHVIGQIKTQIRRQENWKSIKEIPQQYRNQVRRGKDKPVNQDITRSEKQQQKDYRKTAAALETANRTGKPVSQYQGRINNYKFSIKGIPGYDVGHKIALCLGGSNNQSNLRNELASDNRARGAKEAQLARDRRERGGGGGGTPGGGGGGGGQPKGGGQSTKQEAQIGGVRFDSTAILKTEQLFNQFGFLKGVSIDERSKKVILLTEKRGQQTGGELYVPFLQSEDFAMALLLVKSCENPSFSLDPDDSSNPEGPFLRKFGEAMFEADFLLKQIAFNCVVHSDGMVSPRASRVINQLRSQAELSFESSNSGRSRWARLWIEPLEMEISVSNSTLVFSKATMQIKAKRMIEDKSVTSGLKDVDSDSDPNDPVQKFAKSFTTYYDQVAEVMHEFARVKELAKAVALAKWLQKQNVDVDSNILRAMVSRTLNFPSERINTIKITHSETYGNTIQRMTFTGGVNLQSNVSQSVSNKKAELESLHNRAVAALATKFDNIDEEVDSAAHIENSNVSVGVLHFLVTTGSQNGVSFAEEPVITPSDLHAKANSFFKEKKYVEAVQFYIPKNDPLIAQLLTNRAACYLNMGKPGAALEDANLAIQVDPSWAKGYLLRARVFQQQGKTTIAYRTIAHGMQVARKTDVLKDLHASLSAEVQKTISEWIKLAQLHSANPKKAIPFIDKALCVDSRNQEALLLRAQLYNDAGDLRAAIRDIDVVLSLSSTNSTAYKLRADILQKVGEYHKAIETYQKALEAVEFSCAPNSQSQIKQQVKYAKATARKSLELLVQTVADTFTDFPYLDGLIWMMRPTLWDIKWMEGESLVLVPFNSNTNLSLELGEWSLPTITVRPLSLPEELFDVDPNELVEAIKSMQLSEIETNNQRIAEGEDLIKLELAQPQTETIITVMDAIPLEEEEEKEEDEEDSEPLLKLDAPVVSVTLTGNVEDGYAVCLRSAWVVINDLILVVTLAVKAEFYDAYLPIFSRLLTSMQLTPA